MLKSRFVILHTLHSDSRSGLEHILEEVPGIAARKCNEP